MADSSSSSLKGESRSRRSWTISAESSAMESNGRSSPDSTLERPKTQGGEAADPNRAGPSGFSKLLEARRRRKEKKKNQRGDEPAVPTVVLENELLESRSNDSRDGTSAGASSVAESSKQEGDLINLLTDDSEPDGPPPLTSHNSHTGFYTSSSPLIKTGSVDATQPESSHVDTESSFSAHGSESPTPDKRSQSRRPTQSSMALDVPVDSSSKKRSPSPGRRLKGAFSSDKKAANDESDAVSIKSAGNKSGRGLFGASRRSSLSSKRAQTTPEDPPPMPAPIRTDLTEDKPRSLQASPMPNTPPHTAIPAPATTVTPPTPTEHRPLSAQLFSDNVTNSPETIQSPDSISSGITTVSPSGNMISHRRVRSASAAHGPSKLSNAVSALTPLDEKTTPGTKNSASNQAGGFFSSVFSVAQNAATSFSNSLNAQQKNRSNSQPTAGDADKSTKQAMEEGEAASDDSSKIEEGRPSAVETLGAGDLNFSHLDIDARPGETITTADGVVISKPGSPADKRKNTAVYRRDEEAAKLEDKRAARAVQVAYERPETSSMGGPGEDALEIQSTTSLPKDGQIPGDQTPPSGSVLDGDLSGGLRRTGSVRSRLARRHRGSSGATASTIGAIGANAIGIAAPGVNSSVPRLTGFAVASKKRNRDFHQLFRSVPEDDYLIEDYSCALQREIILAGRIYISEGHICFSSNILGWVTTLVISFDEIVAIEKESTAMVFPNAIAIQTLHARHTFRSLLSRESTYDLMVNIWKINHPTIKSSVNGTRVTDGTGDKTEKVGEEESESESDVSDEDEIYDEDEEGDAESFFEAGGSANASATSLPVRAGLSRKPSSLSANAAAPAAGTNANGEKKNGDKGASKDAPPDFPGPTTHAPTEYTDPDGQYEKVIKDEIIAAPSAKSSGDFMTKFLVDNQKSGELQFEGTAKGLTNESPTRKYSYIKPLNGSIGPKQTKCISTENLDFLDLEKAVLVTLSTQTPDVPSGNVFATKTKYLFTWAANNQTRFLMTCTIEWSGKSAIDGQTSFGNDLIKALQAGVVSKGRTNGAGRGKGKRKKGDGSGRESTAAASVKATVDSNVGKAESWGLFEPVRPLLEPFASILSPLWSSNVAILVIGVLFYLAFFRSSATSIHAHDVGCTGHGLPQRLAAYEEMWRREETELWNWLEDRVGMDGMVFPNVYRSSEPHASRRSPGVSTSDEREFAAQLRDEKVSNSEMDHAIRTTRQRLDVLEEMMGKRAAQLKVDESAKSEL
ncbi:uncharacterized protein N7515_000388 [Penicillium bovifimosum]|uniref:VASt domain-containing protein n=1 Tax=Penicillium bovifimosum TaxID=126998 RepID=A0A9W9L9U7_9EURO|nr:uncharacterized protein N7515_000388 [Penicillium bovifimosum]KAJ5145824.1 hypothetical protein N7515_000388 [Penicillium bovifimosum]